MTWAPRFFRFGRGTRPRIGAAGGAPSTLPKSLGRNKAEVDIDGVGWTEGDDGFNSCAGEDNGYGVVVEVAECCATDAAGDARSC